MNLHTLQRSFSKVSRKRVGRGGKRGTYSGRGLKGQRSRAGARIRPAIRDYIKQLPKRRGYQFGRIKGKFIPISIADLEYAASDGERITPRTLVTLGLVKKRGRHIPTVKILGDGTLTKKLSVAACALSKSAREKIEAAGGSIHP
ncbi:MAG: uL15 family ribosomal protein [Parcubacteria group bacterium]|nr:uL15 family ribosomal protein [Parcubacteria group bacterium]